MTTASRPPGFSTRPTSRKHAGKSTQKYTVSHAVTTSNYASSNGTAFTLASSLDALGADDLLGAGDITLGLGESLLDVHHAGAGVFAHLPNVAWTSAGPVHPEAFARLRPQLQRAGIQRVGLSVQLAP